MKASVFYLLTATQEQVPYPLLERFEIQSKMKQCGPTCYDLFSLEQRQIFELKKAVYLATKTWPDTALVPKKFTHF